MSKTGNLERVVARIYGAGWALAVMLWVVTAGLEMFGSEHWAEAIGKAGVMSVLIGVGVALCARFLTDN